MSRLRVIGTGTLSCALLLVGKLALADGPLNRPRIMMAFQQSNLHCDTMVGLLRQAFDDPNLRFASQPKRNLVFVQAR